MQLRCSTAGVEHLASRLVAQKMKSCPACTCTMSSSALTTFNGCREQRVATATMPPAEAPAQQIRHIASHDGVTLLPLSQTAAATQTVQPTCTCNGRVCIQQAQLLQDLCCSQLVGSSQRGSAEAHTQLSMLCRCQHGITAAVPVLALLLLPVGFRAVLPHAAHVLCLDLFMFGVFAGGKSVHALLLAFAVAKNARGVIRAGDDLLSNLMCKTVRRGLYPQGPCIPSCCGACCSAAHMHAGARDAAVG